MAFWDTDLTTRMGAQSAADQGGLASFVFAGLTALGGVIAVGAVGYSSVQGIAGLTAVAIVCAIAIIAGLRLRAGKGAFWGIAIAGILVLTTLGDVLLGAIGIGLIFRAILLVILVQGVRGAFALRHEYGFYEDDLETFE